MNKKLLTATIALCSCLIAFGIAGCEKHSHTYSEDWSSDEAYHWHAATCEHAEEISGKAEHTWNAGEVTIQPTHLKEGETTYTCTVCGATKTEKIEADAEAHDWSDWTKYSETQHRRTCECGAEEIEDHVWDAGEVTVRPTHLKEGETTYTCTVCGATKTEKIEADAEAHDWSDWTKYSETQHRRTCECGAEEIEDHVWDAGEVTIAPTHLTEGTILYTCTVCGAEKTETKPASEDEHTFSAEWNNDENGHWHNADCGHDVISSYAAHTFGEWKLITAPSETKDGLWQRICTVCEYVDSNVVAAHSHIHADSDSGTIRSHATTTDGKTVTYGTATYTCTICGLSYETEYKEDVTAISGGREIAPARIISAGTYVTFVNSATVEDEETGIEHTIPVEKYFVLYCNVEEGATFTVTLLYSEVAFASDPNYSFDNVYGEGSFNVVLEYKESFIFLLSTTAGEVSEDYNVSLMFSVEISDPPPVGSVYRPIAMTFTDDDITATVQADERVYYKMDPAVLSEYIIFQYEDPVSIYYLEFDKFEQNATGTLVTSGATLTISSYYVTYIYVVSSTGEISFTVENARVKGTIDNPIEVQEGVEYTTSEFNSKYQSEWYSFTPEESGNYIWKGTSSGSGTPYAYIYTNINGEYDSYGTTMFLCSLTAGNTYYFEIAENNSNGKITFSLEKSNGNTGLKAADAIQIDNDGYTVENVVSGVMFYYIYKASTTGYVSITVEPASTKITSKFFGVDGNFNSSSYTSSVNKVVIMEGSVIRFTIMSGGYSDEMAIRVTFEEVAFYSVAFETGKENITVASQLIAEGTTATQPTDPVSTGYLFVGWYSDSDFTTEFDFSSTITSNITLYAKWEEQQIEERPGSGTQKDPYILTGSATLEGETNASGTWYSYTASANGTATVTMDPNESIGVQVSVDGTLKGYIMVGDSTSLTVTFTKGQTLTLGVFCMDTSYVPIEGEYSFQFEVVEGSGTQTDPYILKGSATLEGETNASGTWYSYTASANGKATVTMDPNESIGVQVSVDGELQGYIMMGVSTSLTVTFTKGQTLTLGVFCMDTSYVPIEGEYSFQFEVVEGSGTQKDPYILTGSAMLEGETNASGTWYSYTVSANGTATVKLYALKKEQTIKSNAHFWREFNNLDKINDFDVDVQKYEQELKNNAISLVCSFDDEFPKSPTNLKVSEKPFLFAFKGDIKLLENIMKNVAIVGVLTPTPNIIERERKIVERLVQKEFCIISGLAKGCDTVAHKESLLNGGKTIAILPSNLENIYPKKNAELAEKIVQNGGLVITEYITVPLNRFENVKRFIERDRLQAMFAEKIILIASYAQGKGDSGSRHAMGKAQEYGKERFVMFNEQTDKGSPIFRLNESLVEDGVTILTTKILNDY